MSHDHAHSQEHGHGHGDHADGEYHGPTSFWTKYVFSIDHKIIGIQFMFTSLLFVIVGGLLALGLRYELAWPGQEVPHSKILPGNMTQVGPEANVAHWKVGNAVKFTADTKVGEVTYPAGTIAKVTGFPEGYAVTIPYGTRIKGNQYALAANRNAYVKDTSSVMGDYQFERQQIRAPIGTKVYEVLDDGTIGKEPVELAGAPDYQWIGDNPILLHTGHMLPDDKGKPAITQVTPVKLSIAAQKVPALAAPGVEQKDVAAAEVTVINGALQYDKTTLKNEGYNQLFTMHASIMIFFVIIPMLVGAFGNFLVPLMIGARDMAFPKLNMLSYWLAMPAGIFMIVSLWLESGSAQGGWTQYPPLSSIRFSPNLGTTLWVGGVALVGFSSIVGALNYITTTINMRAPGMSLFRMPLTVWSVLITSILALLATPVLTAAMIMLTLDRTMGTQFFTDTVINSEGVQVAAGGQPLMWQHLFWFYSHPAVYIMILPAMGVTSDILSTFARKPIFGYKPMVLAIGGIAFLGFIVWGHHMFQSGMNPVLGTTFMASTIFIAVPSAIKTFNWLGTLWGGNIKFTPPMLFALGFVSMFVIGGLSGIFMASAPVDIPLHDTYFIVAHIHYVLFGGSIMGIFAGIYHWFPKMFGRQMNQKWGVIHFIMTFIAFNGTFFIMHVLGIGGHPRRYATIMKYDTLHHLQGMNVAQTIFAMMLGMAQIPFFYNFFVSLPRRLGRAMTAIFVIGLVAPAVIGLSVWAAKNGLGWTPDKGAEAKRMMVDMVAVQPEVKVDDALVKGSWQYSGIATALGALGLMGTLILTLVLLLRGLPRGGKIAAVCTILPVMYFSILTLGSGSKLYDDKGALDARFENHTAYAKELDKLIVPSNTDKAAITARVTQLLSNGIVEPQLVNKVEETKRKEAKAAMIKQAEATIAAAPLKEVDAIKKTAGKPDEKVKISQLADAHGLVATLRSQAKTLRDRPQLESGKMWFDIAVGIGHGCLFGAAIVGLIWLVWHFGGMIGVPGFLQRAMYIVFLPLFLLPALIKHDTYMFFENLPIIGWFVSPSTYDLRWVLVILAALPGAIYLVVWKPKDEFGHNVGANPWHANSLDWVATTSPPLAHGNFEVIPHVYRGAYEYSSPVVKEDWLPQTTPLQPGEAELQASGH